MSRPLPRKIMSLHNACMPTTTRIRDHVHPLPLSQRISSQHLPNLKTVATTIAPKLSRETTGLTTSLNNQILTSRLPNLLATTTYISNLTTLRATSQPTRLVTKSQLNSLVTVALKRTYFSHNARTSLNNRNRDNHPIVSVDLRHSNFFTEQPDRHSMHLHVKQKVILSPNRTPSAVNRNKNDSTPTPPKATTPQPSP
jgi:hypothetical protein